jgi:lipopolysaccharide transport system ATP-binding protein
MTRRAKAQETEEASIWALRDVSLNVQEGEVLGLIGRNGAGKSTLLKILSRITEPTEGRALIRGRVASLLEVGTGFHGDLTGRENVFLNGSILGMRREEIRRRFDEIVAFSEVERFIDTPVKRYSSGMYMRLAFAVAAHLEPEILIVDEVLAVGDVHFQRRCMGRMKEVASSGRTVLFVSHNLAAIERLSAAVAWIDGGRIAAFDRDVRAVLNSYLGASSGAEPAGAVLDRVIEGKGVRVHRFAVVDSAGSPWTRPIPNDADAWIEADLELAREDRGLYFGYLLYGPDDELLYRSTTRDVAESAWPLLRRGRCVLRTRLPRRLFNEGTYRVVLLGDVRHVEWVLEPGRTAAEIRFTVRGGMSDSPAYQDTRAGHLAPMLGWEACTRDASSVAERQE